MDKFMTFDPFLSFAENEKGVREKAFFKVDGNPTYDGSWGSYEAPQFWYTGRQAYAVVAKKVGFQPTIEDFDSWYSQITILELDLIKTFQPKVDAGELLLVYESDEVPILDLLAHAKDTDVGHITLFSAKIFREMFVGGAPVSDGLPDFELILSVLAVMSIDDCIIADNLKHGFENALNTLHNYLNGAASYKETLEVKKATTTNQARKAGQERHRESQEVKKTVIDEWCKQKGEYNSRADFVRIRSAEYGVKQRTLDKWIADHEKESRKRTTGS